MEINEQHRKLSRVAYLCLQATIEGQASYAHVHEIIKGLEHRGIRVELLQPSYVMKNAAPGAFGRCLEFARVQGRLMRRLKQFDCLYVRGHFAALPIALFARLIRIPVVQEVNGSYDELFECWPWTRMFSQLFIRATRKQWQISNAIIVVAQKMGKWVEKEGGNACWHVVPNGADVEPLHPRAIPDPSVKIPDTPYAVFFGALSPWQGIGPLLEAVDRPEWPNINLVIVGDGP